MSNMTHGQKLDRLVFERLRPLIPFWMEDEKKWLVVFPNEWDHEVERFETQEDARQFISTLK